MSLQVPANAFISELVKRGSLEVRRPAAMSAALAELATELARPPTGTELEDWFDDNPLVCELFVGAAALDDAASRHFGAAFAPRQDAPTARHPQLEAAIADDPDSAEPYLVYSDWLQEQGDPTGELIRLGVAAASDDAAQVKFGRFLARHEAWIFGDLDGEARRHLQLSWRHGFVEAVRGSLELPGKHWSTLWGRRVCSFVRRYRVVLETANTHALDAMLDAFVDHAPPTVAELALHDIAAIELPARVCKAGLSTLTLGGRRARLPNRLPETLTTLNLHVESPAVAESADGQWPLESLSVEASSDLADVLRRTSLPRLRHLTVRATLGADGIDPVLEALGEHDLPALKRVELAAGTTPAHLQRLSRLPLAGRIRSVGLTDGGLSDRELAGIVDCVPAFATLRSIDVSGNELTPTGLSALARLGVDVDNRGQQAVGTAARERLRVFGGSRFAVALDIADSDRFVETGLDGEVCWARYRGTSEYQVFVRVDRFRYQCNCPSSISPCKHVVALALRHQYGRVPVARVRTPYAQGVVADFARSLDEP